ncbi:hypothetical protein I1A_002842 [Pseudomonas fluorescens R124]|uniref:Uncharacterized protein n=1 Tax=Pseudomonas fluorescens R124 TaxID=743713 RepID=A0A7U9CPA0_PSEFL|nr:hypothetical protein [Pseudomonas fluorescens]EJZ58514.1 hypothetical protein I1A_002842 [Pseudomonas fluorescens R124]
MSEVSRYWVNGDGYLFGCSSAWEPKDDELVMWPDFKRVQDERDALQLRLNAADQRIDDLAAAAEPFANVADLYAGEEDDSHEPARDVGMHDDLRLTLGHFRALNDLCTKRLIKS